MDRVKIFKLWMPVLLWAGLIFICSGIPNLKTNLPEDFILRKAAHVTEYFLLAFLLRRAFCGTFAMNARSLFLYPATVALLYAISDEIHQSFTPGRTCSMGDVVIDAAGIILFYVLLRIFKRQPNA